MEEVTTVVFSNIFKRDKKLYALKDIQLIVPLSFKMIRDFMFCVLVWFLPIFLIGGTGFIFKSPVTLMFTIAPTVGLAILISKPNVVFNNKNFYTWLACNIKYLFSAKCFTDGKKCNIKNGDTINGDFLVWLGDSRLDDYGNDIDVDAKPKGSRRKKKQ